MKLSTESTNNFRERCTLNTSCVIFPYHKNNPCNIDPHLATEQRLSSQTADCFYCIDKDMSTFTGMYIKNIISGLYSSTVYALVVMLVHKGGSESKFTV